MVIDPSLPLGRRLKVLRVARGLRQRDLAASTGLSSSIVSMIETGDRPPRDSELHAILKALGVRREDVDSAKRTR
jgi:transcriptional regulator with XRE-family HTH domain